MPGFPVLDLELVPVPSDPSFTVHTSLLVQLIETVWWRHKLLPRVTSSPVARPFDGLPGPGHRVQ